MKSKRKKGLVQEQVIKYVIRNFPQVKGSNTELYIKMMELYCLKRGVTVPSEINQFMRQHKPEQIVRLRRRLVKPTNQQREEEKRYKQEYSLNN